MTSANAETQKAETQTLKPSYWREDWNSREIDSHGPSTPRGLSLHRSKLCRPKSSTTESLLNMQPSKPEIDVPYMLQTTPRMIVLGVILSFFGWLCVAGAFLL
jgi:hypothetical protein